MLTAFGAHKHGALRTVRPYVFAYKLRFSARDFLALTKKILVFRGALKRVSKFPDLGLFLNSFDRQLLGIDF